jgi:hypothetical protein
VCVRSHTRDNTELELPSSRPMDMPVAGKGLETNLRRIGSFRRGKEAN